VLHNRFPPIQPKALAITAPREGDITKKEATWST